MWFVMRSAQAALAGLDRSRAGRVTRRDLVDDEALGSSSDDRLADQLLGPDVHLGRVDESHPEVEPDAQRVDLLLPLVRVLAEVPRPLTEDGHSFPRWEFDPSHRLLHAVAARLPHITTCAAERNGQSEQPARRGQTWWCLRDASARRADRHRTR